MKKFLFLLRKEAREKYSYQKMNAYPSAVYLQEIQTQHRDVSNHIPVLCGNDVEQPLG